VLVVLDCCYSGALVDNEPTKGKDAEPRRGGDRKFAAPFLRQEARQIIMSSGIEALDGKDSLSPFCRAFLDALSPRSGRGFVDAREVHHLIGAQMSRVQVNGGMQEPSLLRVGQGAGSFVFFLPE
jgi:hypothetical protein